MSILFTGYYGNLNTGDDAFCVISNWAAHKFWKQKSVRFSGRHLPVGHDGMPLISSLPKKNLFRGQHYAEYLFQGLCYRNIVFSGGSIFHSQYNRISNENVLKTLSRIGITRIGAIGVSLGPYKTNGAKGSVKELLKYFSFIALRDRRSYEEAISMQLPIPVVEAFDLAALLPSIYPVQKSENTPPVLGISICPYERFTGVNIEIEAKRLSKVIACTKNLTKIIPDLRIKILVFNRHPYYGDVEFSRQVFDELERKANAEIVEYGGDPKQMWNSIAACDAVLSTRLHAGVFACFTETPFLQIEYHRKCGDFLSDIKYPEEMRIGNFEVSEVEAAEKLASFIQDKPILSRDLDYLKSKALLNFTSFNGFFIKD